MAINFPTGATQNQIYSLGTTSWIFVGSKWKVYPQINNLVQNVSGVDNYVTGGTYSNGTILFTNNNGGTFLVTGLSTSSSTFSGGTINGSTIFTNGLTTNTLSATTYQNLPIDIRITGGTYSNGTATFTNNSGGTFSVSGFSTAVSSTAFTGGTVTGATNFTAGLSANTISATTYQNLPTEVFVTGSTYSNNTFIYRNNTGGTFSVLFNTLTGATVNGNLTITGTTQSSIFSGTTISGGTFYGNSSNVEGLSITNILLTQFFS